MQVTLEAGQDRCTVDVDRGGRLASLVIRGRERLLGDEFADRGPVQWGSFLMAPWVGRLERGRLPWRGTEYRLPADFGPHAIHGVTKDRPWELEYADPQTARLACVLTEPWPFGGVARQAIALRPGRLELEAEVAAGDQAMPAGIGWHPWFRRPPAGTGDMAVRLDATGVLAVKEPGVPTGEVLGLDAATDLRGGPPLGDRSLDTTEVGVTSPAEVAWPDLTLTIHWEPPANSVTVFTPEHAVCVEPQTAWPDAPNLAAAGHGDTGLAVAEPGRPLVARTVWTWEPAGA